MISLIVFAAGLVGIIILGLVLLPVVFQIISFRFDATYKEKFRGFGKFGTEQPFAGQEIIAGINGDGMFAISVGGKVLCTGCATFHAVNRWYTSNKVIATGMPLAVNETRVNTGEDELGNYESSSCRVQSFDGQVNCVLAIRKYADFLGIVFEVQFPAGMEGTPTGSFYHPCAQFPCFRNESASQRVITWRDSIFCPPSYTVKGTGAPEQLGVLAISHRFPTDLLDREIRSGIYGHILQANHLDKQHEKEVGVMN